MAKSTQPHKARFNHPAVFMLIADGECDQIVESNIVAQRERKDLIALGCTVRVRVFQRPTLAEAWAAAEAYEDKLRGR